MSNKTFKNASVTAIGTGAPDSPELQFILGASMNLNPHERLVYSKELNWMIL